MLLARTDPTAALAHRGLSLFLVEKHRGDSGGFCSPRARTSARATARAASRDGPSTRWAIAACTPTSSASTTGSYPTDLVGGEAGLGRGFYFQMAGFENGRLQTAARAVGVMQAAYEAALEYARHRVVFGEPIIDYELTRVKLGTMAAIIQCSRQFSLEVAREMGAAAGALEASMAKAYVCRAAEWVTREAMQIHGGMGYAEEYPVSRYFVDARVLSIFEGADETLCLKVIAAVCSRRHG
jgi:(2S)-methylsuccinyl-CoA dehydrogenase